MSAMETLFGGAGRRKRSTAAAQDVTGLPFEDLLALKYKVDMEVSQRQAQELEEMRAKAAQMANGLGLSVEAIFGLRDRKRRTADKRTLPAKYRGPNGELWSDKGPPPQWLKPLLADGKSKDDFRI